MKDLSYQKRLSERIRLILENAETLKKGKEGINIAKQKFDYKVLSLKLLDALNRIYEKPRFK